MTDVSKLRVIICYKNFLATSQGISHIGLGVAALNNAKMLQRAGIRTEILPMRYDTDLRKFLNLQASSGELPVTHVIVSAPWVRTQMFQYLCATFPTIQFAMNCHSNVGFLQADSNGIRLIREGLALEAGVHNFSVAGNSERFSRFIYNAYGSPCKYLPNMYSLDGTSEPHRPSWPSTKGVLRIGAFGATRSQKNFITACGAALEISRDLKAQTEIWINSQRDDGPETKRILRAAHMMLDGLPNISLRYAPWAAWPNFRRTVENMHLLLQISYTERFNMVTCDGIATGVPSVISDAITWAPESWQAKADDVFDIAQVGIGLIHNPRAARAGLQALNVHNRDGMHAWYRFLGIDRFMSGHSSEAVRMFDAGDITSY